MMEDTDIEAPEAPVESVEVAEEQVTDAIRPSTNELSQDAEQCDKETDEDAKQLASVKDVFSFGAGPKKRLCLVLGTFCAVVSGCVFPAVAFFFAASFQDLGASTENTDFLKNIRELAFTFMILGALAFIFMSGQATCFETAAGEMTHSLKTQWFDALLRQDMAYFDIKDVSATATIISSNGAKYRK